MSAAPMVDVEYPIQADREAEEALIACCLVDHTAPARVLAVVGPGDMVTDPARQAFERIAGCVADGRPVAMNTVAGGDVPVRWLGDLMRNTAALTAAGTVDYWAQFVARAAASRRVLQLAHGAMGAVLGGEDAGEVAARLVESLRETSARRAARTRMLEEIVSDGGWEAMDRWMADPRALAGPSTGIHHLDVYLGGFGSGRVITLGADTGVGKSLFVQQLVRTCSEALVPVHLVSTEMSELEVLSRLAFQEAGWDKLTATRRGHVRDSERDSLLDGLDRLARRPVAVTELRGMGIDALEAEVHRVRETIGTRVLVLDLLNGLPTVGDNRAQGIAVNTNRIKQMAEREQLCVVQTAHINRDSAKGLGELGLHSFRDSGAIEQDSDQVGILVPVDSTGARLPRQEVTALVSGGQSVEVAVIICKNRHGPEGIVRTRLSWAHGGRFYPVDAA